jgi:hypothetical protein
MAAMPAYESLPFVDEHSVTTDLPRERVWQEVVRSAPERGFTVTGRDAPERLVLEGRHPFSRYALVFLVHPVDGGGSRVRAQTWAAFPGAHGRAYRALVIGSGMHARIVRRMVRGIAGRA